MSDDEMFENARAMLPIIESVVYKKAQKYTSPIRLLVYVNPRSIRFDCHSKIISQAIHDVGARYSNDFIELAFLFEGKVFSNDNYAGEPKIMKCG